MESTADEFSSEAGHGNGSAARRAARKTRAASNRELQNLISDVEDLISRIGQAADPEIARVRAKVESAMASAKESIADGAERAQRQAKDLLDSGDRYVRDRPWEAIGVAAIVGLAIGFLVSRRF